MIGLIICLKKEDSREEVLFFKPFFAENARGWGKIANFAILKTVA